MPSGRKALIWVQRILIAAGIAALTYCGLASFRSWRFQKQAQAVLEDAEPQRMVSKALPDEHSGPAEETSDPGPDILGRIEIPRLRISAMVADGTSPQVLDVAVGHIPGTGVPGQVGNTALAAHRDTFFRGLGAIRAGDLVHFTEPGKRYPYSVTSTSIVDPRDIWVLASGPNEELTLITCYPFHFIGAAPQRFVVHARLLAEADADVSPVRAPAHPNAHPVGNIS